MDAKLTADQVDSRDSFVVFLVSLADCARENSESISDSTLATFLDGAAGWTADMDGYFLNRGDPTPSEPSWRLLAQIFAAGLVYE